MNENSKYLRSIAYAVAVVPVSIVGTVAVYLWFAVAMFAATQDGLERFAAPSAIAGVVAGIATFVAIVVFAVKSLNALSVKTWGLDVVSAK